MTFSFILLKVACEVFEKSSKIHINVLMSVIRLANQRHDYIQQTDNVSSKLNTFDPRIASVDQVY